MSSVPILKFGGRSGEIQCAISFLKLTSYQSLLNIQLYEDIRPPTQTTMFYAAAVVTFLLYCFTYLGVRHVQTSSWNHFLEELIFVNESIN